jgi:hypothetical protein
MVRMCWTNVWRFNAVEAFGWIIENGVVDVVDGGSKLVSSDGKDEAVSSPCFSRGDVDGA